MYRLKPFLFGIVLLALVACDAQDTPRIIRVGHTLDTSHSVHLALEHMAGQLADYSDGKMQIKLYPNGQLGSERAMVELLQIGSLSMTKVSAASLEGFVPQMKVFGVPYLFRSDQHRWQVLESSIGQDILNATRSARFTGMAYMDAGSRSFYMTQDPVNRPADVKGKKIRVMNSPMAVQLIDAMQGAATPLGWGELYAALQQGVVDGAENNPPSYYSSRHYEIAGYYTLNEHASIPDVIIASNHVLNSLSKQENEWLRRAMKDAVNKQRQLWNEAEQQALMKLARAGVSISRPDKTPFYQAVEPLHQQLSETNLGPLIKRIKAMRGEE
ncbi:TRAP transporter substrate-binding protein [Lacimicrobium alkaliphilum]|uniref:C4-dicarboxylate ABC transporter substrate-binding protein n=1 Tax=Lacimicrobium alkaliphilum TaxID=1526571 RepID=A0ABQ1RA77_9ALTE|nr:TRAP transporter substrate-binding protein [Lacimicrobium alkaliphilum]GGD60381.1 C4-dicarboxylate ABC transporter substrate-binding protein [Lacimicrobium alkaliphilum]